MRTCIAGRFTWRTRAHDVKRAAFTFIEVMAVVLLLGLLSAATVWSLAGDVRRGSRRGALQQVLQAERLVRLAARRTGQPTVLQVDLNRSELRRMERQDGELRAAGPTVRFSTARGVRLDRMMVSGESLWLEEDSGRRRVQAVHSGVMEVAYSTQGRSETFALRLAWDAEVMSPGFESEADVFRGDGVWMVFAGVTGQVTLLHDEREVQNLFAWLESGGLDAR